jgi:hypothetical protein
MLLEADGIGGVLDGGRLTASLGELLGILLLGSPTVEFDGLFDDFNLFALLHVDIYLNKNLLG